MTIVTAILVLAIVETFLVDSAFLIVASAKRVLDAGVELPIGIKITALFWLVVGYQADFVYNALVGSWRFREAPKWRRREWLYSGRVQRLVHSGNERKRTIALYWASILNAADPSPHIKL